MDFFSEQYNFFSLLYLSGIMFNDGIHRQNVIFVNTYDYFQSVDMTIFEVSKKIPLLISEDISKGNDIN